MSRYQREKSSERGVISVTNASALSGLAMMSIDEMDLPVYIVALREVCPEMAAAAFFPAKRSAGDQLRDNDQVARRGVMRLGRGGRVERRYSICEPVARSEQSDRAPHEIADAIG